MKVKSTGLGRTQLTAHIEGFFIKDDGSSAVMVIESTEPVHWHIECDMGGRDLRHFAGFVLKPRVLFSLVRLLITGGEAKGFVMEKEGGKRAAKKRTAAASSTPAAGNGSAAVVGETNGKGADFVVTAAVAEAESVSAPPPLVRLEALRGSRGSEDDDARSEREQRRAERRQAREEHAQKATAN
jgi:hypothetical protein